MLKILQKHCFHLVNISPWPFFIGFASLFIAVGFIFYLHFYVLSSFIFCFSIFILIFISFLWWKDIIIESTFQGNHTKKVQTGLRFGILLFIISEFMFFFAFFWAFFSTGLTPSEFLGSFWPPPGIFVLNAWQIPFLNTCFLLLSGCSCTWVHNSILFGKRMEALLSLFLTIFLGLIFTLFQIFEYFESSFCFSDSVYGSIFFLATGFHGFHVLIGTNFLLACFIRLYCHHFTTEHHFGFESAAWYWHFVDCIWLFLFVAIYFWGS